jgi:membrane-associated protease RseP (regulator of RpoE activity)
VAAATTRRSSPPACRVDWGLKGRSNYFQHTWHTQWDTIDVAIEEYQRHTATVIALAALGTANLPELLDRTGVGATGGNQSAAASRRAGSTAELDGLTFTSVKEGGRAATMGVKKGDVLLKVNGEEIERVRQVFQIAREVEGDEVTFTFKRGETTFDAKTKKDELPARRRAGRVVGPVGPGDTVPPSGGTRQPSSGSSPSPAGSGSGGR